MWHKREKFNKLLITFSKCIFKHYSNTCLIFIKLTNIWSITAKHHLYISLKYLPNILQIFHVLICINDSASLVYYMSKHLSYKGPKIYSKNFFKKQYITAISFEYPFYCWILIKLLSFGKYVFPSCDTPIQMYPRYLISSFSHSNDHFFNQLCTLFKLFCCFCDEIFGLLEAKSLANLLESLLLGIGVVVARIDLR